MARLALADGTGPIIVDLLREAVTHYLALLQGALYKDGPDPVLVLDVIPAASSLDRRYS